MKLVLKIHRSLRNPEDPEVIEHQGEGILRALILQAVSNHVFIRDVLFEGERLKPGILYIYNGTELSSMGLLEEQIEEDMIIKIVPILHGG